MDKPKKEKPTKKGDVEKPAKDVRVEPGQPTFKEALTRVVKKK